jgi:hypothetical protein
MKKYLLLILLVSFVSLFSHAQQVPRELVVVEIGTGTWCPYCPGAAMGAEDLIENGYDVAIIKYHNGDDYTNTYSNARNSYYGVPGFPTAYFDGGNSVVGGSSTESMFPYYYPKVNARMAIQSSFTIEATGTHTCLSEFTAHITLTKVASTTGSNFRLHTVVTESNIPEAWQGMDELDYVERLMAPNQNGVSIVFGQEVEIQLWDIPFTVDPSWVLENCEVVIFLQDNATKQVHQAIKMPLMDFTPEYEYDAAVKEVFDVPVTSCNGNMEPSLKLRNLGSESMNAVDIYYQVNGGELQSFAWNGTLDYLGEELVTLPAVTFTGDEDNSIVVYTSNPNGNPDECQANDSKTVTFPAAMHTPNTVKLILRTDNNPGETTWELKNSAGDVLDSGGPYSTAGQMVQKTWNLTTEDCHTFVIHDAGGNGLLNPGFFMLYHGSNTTIYQGGVFGLSEIVDFNTADAVGIDEPEMLTSVKVFPNPVQDKANIVITLENQANVNIKVYSVTGQLVVDLEEGNLSAGEHSIMVDASSWKQGLYLYQVVAGDQIFSGKITVR